MEQINTLKLIRKGQEIWPKLLEEGERCRSHTIFEHSASTESEGLSVNTDRMNDFTSTKHVGKSHFPESNLVQFSIEAEVRRKGSALRCQEPGEDLDTFFFFFSIRKQPLAYFLPGLGLSRIVEYLQRFGAAALDAGGKQLPPREGNKTQPQEHPTLQEPSWSRPAWPQQTVPKREGMTLSSEVRVKLHCFLR